MFAAGLPRTARAEDAAPAPQMSPVHWIGEVINYRVAFGVIPAGAARLSVLDTTTLDGHTAVHAISTARSAKAFDVVYRVRDSIETWFDADSVYSLRFHKRLSEGRFHDDQKVVYDHANGLAQLWSRGKEKPVQNVDPHVVDVLAAGYKARTVPLSVGDTILFKTHDVDKVYDLLVFVRGRETVETPAGRFDCFKVEPVLKSGGLFQKEKSARVFIWVTADQRRIPVQMQSKVSFGSVTATMDAYTPPTGHTP
ncbi:MAG TPA: DUF3108 domain-containing protein [bacterium]|jgi:hypothetical protein